MSGLFPIVSHQPCYLSSSELEIAERTAAAQLREKPHLRLDPIFQDLVPASINDLHCLHVDDLTEIQQADSDDAFQHERARLRATEGDLIAVSVPQVVGYEFYCQDCLGLGAVQWLEPDCGSHPLRLAEACWQDREIRRELVRQIRRNEMRYLHPHMGSRAVWELALLLSQASHRRVEVIASPPGVTALANDKAAFAALVDEMLGSEATPANSVAWNAATTAKRLQQLAATPTRMVCIKLPSSAGGEGNLLIPISDVRDHSLHEIDAMLHQRLPDLEYECGDELLVTQWIDDIVAAPSAQIWIPPASNELPILEGIFAQVTAGEEGFFSGFHPVDLPTRLQHQLTRQCLQLSRVYQLLGYVGRCSFDMLLIGSDLDAAKLEFIECNARWGGTSLPMTLMNQVFGDWRRQPFSSRYLRVKNAERIVFSDALSALGDALYRRRENRGKYILFNPKRTSYRSDFSIIALHDNWETASASFDNGPFKLCADRLRTATAESNTVG